jgi:hypothetical protein
MQRVLSLSVLCAVYLTACNQSGTRVTALETKVAELESQLTSSKASLSVAEMRIDQLEKESVENAHPKSASFRPDSKGYSTIYTDSGLLMVSLEDIKPYANGYKATFNFGNPQAIAFDDAEIELRWGPARPAEAKAAKYSEWLSKFQTSTQKLGKRLKAGSWNPVEVVISPATAEQIAHIEIQSVTVPTVSMMK